MREQSEALGNALRLLAQNAEIELMFIHKHLLTILYPKKKQKKQTSIYMIAMSIAVVVIKVRSSD